jgi:hypothetical protein
MSTLNILALIGIVAVFVFFSLTLAWAERMTRGIDRSPK